MDVPVIIFVEYVEVPQLQFIDSMGFPVASQRQVRTVQTVQLVSVSTGAVLGGCRHARCCA